MRGSFLKSSKFGRKKRKIFFLKIGACVVLCIASIAGLSYASKADFSNINDIVVEGNSLLKAEEISEKVKAGIEGDYLFLFSKKNALLYPRDYLEHTLVEHFQQLEHVSISTRDLTTLVVAVKERDPVALWCRTFGDVGVDEDECYFMDTASYIFSKAPYFSGNAFFKYYGLLEVENPISEYYTDPNIFADLNKVVTDARSFKLPVTALIASTTLEYELLLSKDGDFKGTFARVLFTRSYPVEKTIENLKLFLSENNFSKKGSTFINTVNYIDLRFGNKIYYKFRN